MMFENLAMHLLDMGAIKFGAFRLKLHDTDPTAPLSPIYIDLQVVRSDVTGFHFVVEALEYIMKKHQIKSDLISDIPTASTPFVSVIAYRNSIPMISPKISKTHGLTGEIDGAYKPGETVLLVDDLITKADSKIEAAKVLEKNGLIVKDVLVLVDREQGGKESLDKMGYNLHAALLLSEMLKFYMEHGKINGVKYQEVTNYLKSSR